MKELDWLRSSDPVFTSRLDDISCHGTFDDFLDEIISETVASRDTHVSVGPAGLAHERQVAPRKYLAALVALGIAAAGVLVGLVTTTGHRPHDLSFKLVGLINGPAWVEVNSAGAPDGYLDCPSTTACYVSVWDRVARPVSYVGFGPVYFSADGGTKWVRRALPEGLELTSPLSCPAAADCYAGGVAGGKAVFVSTTDEGLHWEWSPLSQLGKFGVLSCWAPGGCAGLVISGSTNKTSVLKGPNGPNGPVKLTYRSSLRQHFTSTTDGGATWSEHAFASDEELSSLACTGPRTCVASGRRLVAPGAYAPGVVVYSRDGGGHWESGAVQGIQGILGFSQGSYSLSCSNRSDCVAAADLGQASRPPLGACGPPDGCEATLWDNLSIYGTTDAGTAWQPLPAPSYVQWQGRVVGQGRTPWELPLADMTRLDDLSCPNAKTCWLAGPYGLLATSDGGRTWAVQHLPGSNGAAQVSCPGAATCVALGDLTSPTAHPHGASTVEVPVYRMGPI